MLINFDKGANSSDIKASLEGSDVGNKIRALQKAIMMLLNGESLPSLFITIVRYVLPSEDHTVQKLLLLYLVSFGPRVVLHAHAFGLIYKLRCIMPMEELQLCWTSTCALSSSPSHSHRNHNAKSLVALNMAVEELGG